MDAILFALSADLDPELMDAAIEADECHGRFINT